MNKPPRQLLQTPPGLSISRRRSQRNKNDLLAKFQDDNDELFGEDENLFPPKLEDPYLLEDEFQTLKLLKGTDTLKIKSLRGKPSLSPHGGLQNLQKHMEHDDMFDDLEFDDLQPPVITKEPRLLPSPTILTLSPKRRKSLSEYSEDTNDTEVTSHLGDDDFEDLDNIFGNEESGIYSNAGAVKQHLLRKQQQLQSEAETEERELYSRYKKDEEVNTLKLKDFRYDEEVDEKTVNYEYTRDDFERFEEGFNVDEPIKFDTAKLSRFKRELAPKMSMPNIRQASNSGNLKKFQSSSNLARSTGSHPVFNNNNKIIRKLDRIPSFYHKETERPDVHRANRDMEKQKQQLLSKFMEISEKQKRLHSPSRTHQKLALGLPKKATSKKIGIVRYLNEGVPAYDTRGRMRFNAAAERWEGNDIDLVKFDAVTTNPKLITRNDFENKKIHGNMMFDADNLRWVNLDPDDDVFGGVPNLDDQSPVRAVSKQRPVSPVRPDTRGASTFTQRTVSSADTEVSEEKEEGFEFQLGDRLLERWYREEAKIHKKTHTWFQQETTFTTDHYWEIRKMVVEEEG